MQEAGVLSVVRTNVDIIIITKNNHLVKFPYLSFRSY